MDSNQQENTNKSFASKVVIQQEEYNVPLVEHIVSTYGTDTTLYYHDSNLENGANDNSYRYAGASDAVNNYVCFGMEGDYCDEEYLYQIIGVFDDDIDGKYNVKLIKNKSLENMAFDTTGTNGSNVWETSTINKIYLNGNYLNSLGSYASMIRETAWNVGGNGTSQSTVKTFLDREKVSQARRSKIGLMYLSDYGYAAYPDAWTISLWDYDNATIKTNNWMLIENERWTITPTSSNAFNVFTVSYAGNVSFSTAKIGYATCPVFYLNSNIVLKGGDGTLSNPYIIGE